MARPFLFCCPVTGMNVQGYSEAKKKPSDGMRHYEGVHCTACRSVHIINPETGRLMSDETDRSK
jgi:hypothetical protein